MKTIIVIPSRFGSTRLPGKPLEMVAGRSLVERVWRIAKAVKNVDEVYVATDDQRIVSHVEAFGGKALMTSESCKNGTERAYDAANQLEDTPDVIINLQGDASLTPPWIVQALVDEMHANADLPIATPATRMDMAQYDKLKASKAAGEVSGTSVTFDKDMNAMYFSKSLIPFIRGEFDPLPIWRHIGLYAYRYEALKNYLSLPEGRFEKAEQIEALRALEHGIKMRIVEVDYQGRTPWAIDAPEDIKITEEIIEREGELIP